MIVVHIFTRYADDIWKLHWNCKINWWTQSSHWRNTGQRSL